MECMSCKLICMTSGLHVLGACVRACMHACTRWVHTCVRRVYAACGSHCKPARMQHAVSQARIAGSILTVILTVLRSKSTCLRVQHMLSLLWSAPCACFFTMHARFRAHTEVKSNPNQNLSPLSMQSATAPRLLGCYCTRLKSDHKQSIPQGQFRYITNLASERCMFSANYTG